MTCEHARELLLESPPGELRGEGESEAARHVRDCPACRKLATAFLAAERVLDEELEALAGAGRSPDEILGAVRRDVEGDHVRRAVGERAATPTASSGAGRWRWRLGLALAAAAVLAALLFLPDGTGPRAPGAADAPVPGEAAFGDGVEVEADRRFAVMKTEDPTIHVVWFY